MKKDKKTFYHGSMMPNLKVLLPKRDPRLEVTGVFLSNEPFGPMAFALLSNRSRAHVEYQSRQGEFHAGKIITPLNLRDEGWLYTTEVCYEDLTSISHSEVYAEMPVEISGVQKVTRKEVMAMGWTLESAYHDLPSFKVIKV